MTKEFNALQESAEKNKELYKYDKPDASLLESFLAPSNDKALNTCKSKQIISITIPEFSSLCPITGQPDFAKIHIKYIPRELCLESKSLKLYILGYRQFGEFHEACVNRLMNDLVALLDPEFLEVRGDFAPRGGIPFCPTSRYVKSESLPPSDGVKEREC